MKEFELKPCPFCGGEALVDMHYHSPHGSIKLFYVICRMCLATTRKELREDKAIEIWNTRTEKDDE